MNKTRVLKGLYCVVALIVIVGGLVYIVRATDLFNILKKADLYKVDQHQIVFMDNDQFYFCKLQDYNREYYLCQEAFYLKTKEVKETDPVTGKQTKDSQLYLTKLGVEEIHQPQDYLWIRKDKVTYIEDFAEDSQLLQAIKNYNPQQPTPTPTPEQVTVPTQTEETTTSTE